MFDLFAAVGQTISRNSKTFTVSSLSMLNQIVGKNWHIRIVNRFCDFGYVREGTVRFYMLERQPMEEFDSAGTVVKLVHRGVLFVFSFGYWTWQQA